MPPAARCASASPSTASDVTIGVWSAGVGRNRLLLLDSNVAGNSDFYRGLTAQLYGGDRNIRLRQEAILGIGGLRACCAWASGPASFISTRATAPLPCWN